MKYQKPKTIILDIDGCVFEHRNTMSNIVQSKMTVLPGTREKFDEWDAKGYNIILITGRRESLRAITEKNLKDSGLFYDTLIMGVGGGIRILINDLKPDCSEETAIAFNLQRNKGISKIDI
jgi:hypothetical protein